MSYETNRRRLLALMVLASAGSVARRAEAQQRFPDNDARPEGVPADVTERVTRDVGSWRVISIANNSQAFIPEERTRIERDGVRKVLAHKDVLVGGAGRIMLEYWSMNQAYSGTLTISTTSNNLSASSAEIFVDGKSVKTVRFEQQAALDLTELFGPNLAGLPAAATISATMEIEGTLYTVYEVELNGTADAMKQMALIPDYNWNVRGLGRPAPLEESNSKPAQCFLTTACCASVGLPDDCFELAALRRYRDTVMIRTPAGRREIEHYYEVAPRILAEMRRRGEEPRLLGLYFGTIIPCALAARLGLVALPHRLYARMMRTLAARYAS